jgi:hypothetical protein
MTIRATPDLNSGQFALRAQIPEPAFFGQLECRVVNHSWAYLNSGSILSLSFVPPGSTTLFSTSFKLS